MDDILVPSETPAQHVETVREVLQALKEHRLKAKKSKCVFGCSAGAFSGPYRWPGRNACGTGQGAGVEEMEDRPLHR